MIKITLDHTALKHLIDNDPEFVLELKTRILAQTIKKSLTLPVEKTALPLLQKMIDDAIEEQIGVVKTQYGRPIKTQISEAFVRASAPIVHREVRELQQEISEKLQKHREVYYAEFEQKLNQAKERMLKQINKQVTIALMDCVNAEILKRTQTVIKNIIESEGANIDE